MYTTGHLERVTGITERTISYYHSLGLLSLKKSKGKKMVTDEDLVSILKIFIMKITHKRLKDIQLMKIESLSLPELMKDLEHMNDSILSLLQGLERYSTEKDQHICFSLLQESDNFLQKYSR
ncbi:MerR family transcriptional regulator [Paenibacillus harenae]|uniref:MerR family transcriptional regulator n=1 Tax=Paenibacillus harenae TaxID=306543 RepID=UPI003593B511